MKKTRGFSNSSWIDNKIRELWITDPENVRTPSAYAEHVFSKNKLVSISYTEGDTCVNEYDSMEEYENELQIARDFYAEND